MKKIITALSFLFCLMIASGAFAQTPPHPNGGGGPGSGNTPVGGGAPIDGGLVLLIAMGSAYAVKKSYKFRKENI
jgi:hypothetical protein